jgi:predicted Rossmann-fold nucleotide-binding protein
MVDEDFMRPEHLNLWTVVSDPAEALEAICQTSDWDANALQMAVNK